MTRRVVLAVMAVTPLATGLLAQTPRPPEPLLSKLLRIAGLTAAPSQMRGPGDNAAAGDVWIASTDRRSVRALTTDGGYRSPIFVNDAPVVLALRGNSVVRLGAQGGSTIPLPDAPHIVKLVGIDATSPGEVVVLLDTPASPLGVLSLQSGRVTPLPYDDSSDEQRRMLAQIRAQDRTYGETRVYTKTETKSGLSRPIEWTDVFLTRGAGSPQNVSACDGANCVQPALSPDGRSVAFVKLQD
jgi:hypothetical protein